MGVLGIMRHKAWLVVELGRNGAHVSCAPLSVSPPQVGITVPIILLVLILVSFVVLRKLHCGNCHKSATHHMGRAMGGPQGDSVGAPL